MLENIQRLTAEQRELIFELIEDIADENVSPPQATRDSARIAR